MDRARALHLEHGGVEPLHLAVRDQLARIAQPRLHLLDLVEIGLDLLFDIGAIRHELLQLLGVPVDVLTPKALPEKFRAAVLAEALAV